MPEQYHTGRVISQESFADRLRILKISAPKLDFVAGQFTKIGLAQGEDKPLMRAYSFVNTPAEEEYEFFYDVLPEGGNLTPLLDQLNPGDEVLVSARPSGLLVLHELPETAKKLFLIGTGTGIGPFISILNTKDPWERFEHITLIYGVRYAADLMFQERIEKFQEHGGEQFTYLPLVTREDAANTHKTRVTDLITSGFLEQQVGFEFAADCQFMLCGNPAMVRETCEILKERGFERNRRARPGNVTIEKYW